VNPCKPHHVLEQTEANLFRPFALIAVAILCFYLAPAGISAQDAELLVSPGKLSLVHANLSGIKNCTACHTGGKRSIPPNAWPAIRTWLFVSKRAGDTTKTKERAASPAILSIRVRNSN
jgi:hypothetical protein